MTFDLSEDQLALRAAVGRYLTDRYDPSIRQAIMRSPHPFSKAHWREMAEMGWLALPFAEDAGGLGASPVDLMLLFEQFGSCALVEPFLDSIVLAGGVIRRLPGARRPELVRGIIAGDRQGAFAHFGAGRADGFGDDGIRAVPADGGFRLSGKKPVVYNLAAADFIVVTAVLTDESLGLFVLSPDTAGLRRDVCSTVDGRSAGDLVANDVLVASDALLASGTIAEQIVSQVIDDLFVAVSAELVGGMARLVKDTTNYLKERRQFGVPLSEFQALQHVLADMFMALELSRSLVMAAAIKLRDGSPDRSQLCAAARLKALRSAKFVGEAALQLHGGIGTTDELIVGHLLKRAVVLGQIYGGESLARDRFAAMRSTKASARETQACPG